MPKLKNLARGAALFFLIALVAALYRTVLPPAAQSMPSNDASSVIARIGPDLVIVNNTLFRVSVASTEEKRRRGLSGQSRLAVNEGMLFIFDQPGRYGFWMKEMLFPIDIIWLDADFQPVHLVENATPESYPVSFYPPQPAKYALEVAAGEWKKAILSTD